MAITTKAKSNFSFRKLSNALDDVLEDYFDDSYEELAQSARENLQNSTGIAPLKESSKYVRRKGISPKGYGLPTTSTKPLVWTGNLLRSIKSSKKGVQAVGYLKYHMEGYTVSNKGLGKKMNFGGKTVPPRNPFFTSEGNLKQNFKRGEKKRTERLINRINKVWRVK